MSEGKDAQKTLVKGTTRDKSGTDEAAMRAEGGKADRRKTGQNQRSQRWNVFRDDES